MLSEGLGHVALPFENRNSAISISSITKTNSGKYLNCDMTTIKKQKKNGFLTSLYKYTSVVK